jgi:hypothetical protein
MLRKNQRHAIDISLSNDFASGVHFHATGTGKSLIASSLLDAYHEKHPQHNVLWLCEQKNILLQLFNAEETRSQKKKFLVLNYAEQKPSNWYTSVNATSFWKKPLLLIINRAFLVSNTKYKRLRIPFHLIIHDECHSVTNATTRAFYDYILNPSAQPSTHTTIPKCIGFSATPVLEHQPFNKILSHYSLYDGFLDDVILPPRIVWYKSNYKLNFDDLFQLIKPEIERLTHKKIIFWCGMLDHCDALAQLSKTYFPNYLVGSDTSLDSSFYDEFYRANDNALLFCAAKHREGSDIPNLDGCVFMDKVACRTAQTFVQCVGRVLRKDCDGTKQSGLVVDCAAKSSLELCNRVNEYLCIRDIFPWKFDYRFHTIGSKHVRIQELLLIRPEERISIDNMSTPSMTHTSGEKELRDIVASFKRPLPNIPKYTQRLTDELKMFHAKGVLPYVFRALEILEITKNIPHVTRGSCGSSLVCYLLGISHVDPVVHNIKFYRFLNEYRDTLPDIDFDFPYHMRDEVFMKLNLRWPGQIARISNHVFYHDKSAKREALRQAGIRGFIGKLEVNKVIRNLRGEQKDIYDRSLSSLDNTFRCYSLHCGGIVFYPEGVPKQFVLERKSNDVLQQITMNKKEVAENKQFKIDILSSRALAQLHECYKHQTITFDDNYFDEQMAAMLARGDNIGITLAESPLMRKALMKIQPKSVSDVAIALSIIRPAAKEARNMNPNTDTSATIIYDDDVIDLMKKLFDCDDDRADKYRRDFIKGKLKVKDKALQKQLNQLRKYGFCKSHAFSYAQLVAKLTFMKLKRPNAFWRATLAHNQTSYRKWVHLQEAVCAGVPLMDVLKQKEVSIYSQLRQQKKDAAMRSHQSTDLYELRTFGYWQMRKHTFFEDCYSRRQENSNMIEFRGIIASYRMLRENHIVIFLGVGCKKYIELVIEQTGRGFHRKLQGDHVGVKGEGFYENGNSKLGVVKCNKYSYF